MKQHFTPLLIVAVLCAAALPVLADGHHGERGEMRGGERHEVRRVERHEIRGWGGERDIRHFGDHHLSIWRDGHWHHGEHGGRLGWWWITAGIWYFYPAPIYPYPDPYLPPVVVLQPPPTPESATPAGAQPPAQSWYYCEASKGYYPYVSSCPAGWKTVPATPPGGK